jgi:hypothetical protein
MLSFILIVLSGKDYLQKKRQTRLISLERLISNLLKKGQGDRDTICLTVVRLIQVEKELRKLSSMSKKQEKPKKQSKRSKSRWPNLDKSLNIKARRDYIEAYYVNGVKDQNGKEVMRALTDEEKDWLNQFYKEEINANLSDAEFNTEAEERKRVYSNNNARNRCLYNQAKKTGKLIKIDPNEYDKQTLKKLDGMDLEHVIIHDRDIYKEEDE